MSKLQNVNIARGSLTILVLTLLFFTANSQDTDFLENVCKLSQAEGHSHHQQHKFKVNTLTNDYDIKYHRIYWKVDPAVADIEGSIYTFFEARVNGLSQIHFDNTPELIIDSVISNGQKLVYSQLANDALRIDLLQTLSIGDQDSLTVFYHGTPDPVADRSFVQSDHNGTPILWTLSEPYGSKEWWPCKQDLNDKIDSIDVLVNCPEGNRVAGNGLLQSVTSVSGNREVHHWKHKYPIPAYLIAFAVTNYAAYTETVNLQNGNIEILNYVYPEDSATSVNQSVTMLPAFRFLDSLLGPYPYMNEKYGHAQFGRGGGMEHATMSFMSGFNLDLMTHELAHQWFGNKVTCGSWQDIWLNEGFATYLSGLRYEFLNPSVWPLWKSNVLMAILADADGSVFVYDTTTVDRIFSGRLSYWKAARVIHMMRWVVGDDAFFNAMRNYLNDPDLSYSYALTDDFKTHLEQESGTNLTEFFNDWIYGEGWPYVEVQWNQQGGLVDVAIGQQPSNSSVSHFEMPVPIRFENQQTGEDTIVVFDHISTWQSYQINLNFTVDKVTFDPDQWLIAQLIGVHNVPNVSLGEPGSVKDFQLYPNPAGNELYIEGCFENLQLISSNGVLLRKYQRDISDCIAFVIDVRNLPPGLYLLKVEENIKRFVKE